MRDASGTKEAGRALESAVDELVRQHDMTRRHILAERAAGGDGDQIGDTEPLHGVDIGAIGDGIGAEPVAAPVAGEERNLYTCDLAAKKGIRRRPPRAVYGDPIGIGQSVQRIEARTADDPEFRRHCRSPHWSGVENQSRV